MLINLGETIRVLNLIRAGGIIICYWSIIELQFFPSGIIDRNMFGSSLININSDSNQDTPRSILNFPSIGGIQIQQYTFTTS